MNRRRSQVGGHVDLSLLLFRLFQLLEIGIYRMMVMILRLDQGKE